MQLLEFTSMVILVIHLLKINKDTKGPFKSTTTVFAYLLLYISGHTFRTILTINYVFCLNKILISCLLIVSTVAV